MIKVKLSSNFIRNVVFVATGTAAAQLITILFSPIITRMYGPEAFGISNIFMSVVGVFSNIGTLCYSMAVVLPKQDWVAYQLIKLSLILALLFSLLAGFVLIAFQTQLTDLLNLQVIYSYFWLIPFAIFMATVLQILDIWYIRYKKFKSLSIVSIAQAGFSSSGRIFAGLVAPTAVTLISVGLIVQFFYILLLYLIARPTFSKAQRHPKKIIAYRKIKILLTVARRYHDFPFYRAPQVFLNTVSRSLPLFLFSSLFGVGVAGWYALAQSTLYLPVSLIAQSVNKVFLQKIASEAHAKKPLRPLIARATFALAAVGMAPFGLVILLGPWLFGFVFGAEWHEAGYYARWLAILVFFHLINAPSVQSLAITSSQSHLLVWEIVTTVFKVILVLFLGVFTNNAELTTAVYAVFGALAYVYLIAMGIMRAEKYDHRL